jgi:hypothetical protein
MKRFLPVLIFWLFLSPVRAQHSLEVYLPVASVSENPVNGKLLAHVFTPLNVRILAGTEAVFHGRWTEEAPDRVNLKTSADLVSFENTEAIFSPLDDEIEVLPGDLIQIALYASTPAPESRQFQLAAQGVFLQDIFGNDFYFLDDLLWGHSGWTEQEAIDSMVRDIRYVGSEMVAMGEPDYVVENGPYAGPSLYAIMQAATVSDLEAFIDFVLKRPAKYRGGHWKVSEVFATWVSEGAPNGDISMEELMAWLSDANEQTKEIEPDCDGVFLEVDLQAGTLNGLRPSASMEEVKEKLPCFSGESEEGADYNCGGGVFFLNHEVFFYTHRDYLEIRDGFAGVLSEELMHQPADEIRAMLGKPDRIPTPPDDLFEGYQAATHWLYKRKFGTLRVSFDPQTGFVNRIGIHSRPVKEVEICW